MLLYLKRGTVILHSIHKLRKVITGFPRIYLAFAGIGLISIAGAILLVSSTNTTAKELTQVGSSTNTTDSHQVLGSQSLPGGSPVTGQDNQAAAGPQQPGVEKVNGSTPGSAQSGGPAANSVNPNLKKPPASSSTSTSTPVRTGYNLNETWYLATAGAEGLFNSCWPAELNENNEAQCIDESNPYSRYWFEGVGISKSAAEAQELAAAQVQQKASEKHIDLRRGGGDDAVVLTESLCSAYGLTCGRW